MSFKITDLTCNYMSTPVGIDDIPHFSYKIVSDESDFTQKSYRICVKNAERTVWDSGEVLSDAQIMIKYGGEALSPKTRYLWTLTVTDTCGERAVGESYFETGMERSAIWDAKWITADPSFIYIGGGEIFKDGKEHNIP